MEEKDRNGYLILTRRPNETLRIGDDIILHVLSVGRSVRLSIEAPADQRILRSELLERPRPNDAPQDKPETTSVTQPRACYPAEQSRAGKAQPVVRYRRRRKLIHHDPDTGEGSAGER